MYGWRYILARITWSPLVILPPLFAVLAAITFAARWGGVGFVAGLPVGLFIGLGAAYIWYRFITSKTAEREEKFRDRLVNDLMAGRLGGRIPPRPTRAMDPIAFDPAKVDGMDPLDPLAHRPPAHEQVPSPTGSPVNVATDVATATRNVLERAETDLESAIAAAGQLCEIRQRDARAGALLAGLLLRGGRREEACRIASESVQMAMLTGADQTAVDVLADFWPERALLTLEPGTAVALARAFMASGQGDHARWCVEKASALGASTVELDGLRDRLSKP